MDVVQAKSNLSQCMLRDQGSHVNASRCTRGLTCTASGSPCQARHRATSRVTKCSAQAQAGQCGSPPAAGQRPARLERREARDVQRAQAVEGPHHLRQRAQHRVPHHARHPAARARLLPCVSELRPHRLLHLRQAGEVCAGCMVKVGHAHTASNRSCSSLAAPRARSSCTPPAPRHWRCAAPPAPCPCACRAHRSLHATNYHTLGSSNLYRCSCRHPKINTHLWTPQQYL